SGGIERAEWCPRVYAEKEEPDDAWPGARGGQRPRESGTREISHNERCTSVNESSNRADGGRGDRSGLPLGVVTVTYSPGKHLRALVDSLPRSTTAGT